MKYSPTFCHRRFLLMSLTERRVGLMSSIKAEKYKEEGNKFFSKGDYITALVKYTEAISENKINPVLYSNRAATFLRLEKWENAIEDCDHGLKLIQWNTSLNSTLIKLLWRKSIGLAEINQLDKALETINGALTVDPKNSTLKAQHQLILSLLNHNSEKIEQDKIENFDNRKDEGMKINSKLTESDVKSNILNIPIQIVDEIPSNFYSENSKQTSSFNKQPRSESFTNESQFPAAKTIEKIENPSNSLPQKPVYDEYNYPSNPSIQFLLSLKEKSENSIESYYLYVLTVNVNHYRNIFKTAGIDPEFLDFFLHSSVYVLENDMIEYGEQIVALLKMFTNLPRFSLTSMFADDKLITSLKKLFISKLNDDFDCYWK
jgi:tetratricopeptide (TPR) repeat protein